MNNAICKAARLHDCHPFISVITTSLKNIGKFKKNAPPEIVPPDIDKKPNL